ncbi:MAG: mannose-1-phosphate guanylyltransferase [Ardenticatenaceae bacterium]|nr:mannose-1-phosphate guanylyltransferase [Ardenticatenaceae bacterium]MCB8946712.1 mannose-1-phosphate guanylyltransferase [Ardenticatenaceae bacterium]
MKIIIFAGGSGRRLWPISRKKSPKQFEPIIGEKSTLRLAVDRVADVYGPENIFISTNERYADMVRDHLPELPTENVIGEPTRRDLAAAVGLAMAHLAKATPEDKLETEPVAILWGDNYMDQVDVFRRVLDGAEKLIANRKAKILFMGETPRFANDQLGWIGLGEVQGTVNGRSYYAFKSLRYRPPLNECQQMFAENTHVWNTGYFVTTIGFVRKQYQKLQPKMWAGLKEIEDAIGQPDYQETLYRVYPNFEVLSFDDAILHHVDPEDALVLHGEMGWSDPGTLYALKEAINPDIKANVTKGKVVVNESKDCLVYNYEADKLVTVIGLEGMIVVNTDDAILVVHKDNIPLVKQVVDNLEGTDLESYS